MHFHLQVQALFTPIPKVCQGDTIRVTVRNHMDNNEGITIHWHGQHQRHSPHMDGTSMITQCPIPRQQSFTYDFVAETPGTQWWHSHSGLQRADGIFGPLIVRQGSDDDDAHGDLFDVDDVEHVLTISDWTDVMAMQHMMMDLHADGPGEPDAILVNGRGTRKRFERNGKEFRIQSQVFTITPGVRYRFRTINTAVTNCPVIISIQNHKLLIIASDGAPMEPISVDGVTVSGGERYDFVVHADQSIDNYWVRFKGADGSECEGLEEEAILRYEGASSDPPRHLANSKETEVVLNLPVVVEKSSSEKPTVAEMRDAEKTDPDIVRAEPDVIHYIEVDSVYRNSPKLHHPVYYPVERGSNMYTAKRTHMLNNISFAFPSAPLLSHSRYVPDNEFCTRETPSRQTGRDCRTEYCSCIHTIEIEMGQIVELVLVTKSMKEFEPHPLHLHGNHFYVIAYDNGEQLPLEEILDIDAQGRLFRNLDRPQRKDTIMMAQRYVILRFKAQNPGWWLFHCHMDLHLELGMAVVFRVGGDNDLPPPAPDMPVCARAGQRDLCDKTPAKENSLERDVAEMERCPSVTVIPNSQNTETVILYVLLPVGLLVSIACVCFISIARKFMAREDKYKYRRLSNGEMEMSVVDR